MTTKKLSEVREEVERLLSRLPGGSPKEWLDREIEVAQHDADRHVPTLRILRASLKRQTKQSKRKTVKRARIRP
jgi:hypothetical protein